jgi:hypothetical protein
MAAGVLRRAKSLDLPEESENIQGSGCFSGVTRRMGIGGDPYFGI